MVSLIVQLKKWTQKYAETPEGAWLNDIEWDDVPLVVMSEFRNPDVMGMYSFGRIYVRDTNLELIFAIYIHELRHRWQWKTKPIFYLIGKVVRPLIENDAYSIQDKADAWIQFTLEEEKQKKKKK